MCVCVAFLLTLVLSRFRDTSSFHRFISFHFTDIAFTPVSVCWSPQRKWYFPGRDNNHRDAPSLEKAWAYYEHFTLARHFDSDNAKHRLERAEPGESMPTELYSPFTTPESSLNEFGIGVASYFSTLRQVAVILLLAGFISLPNILYFSGYSISYKQSGVTPAGGEPRTWHAHVRLDKATYKSLKAYFLEIACRKSQASLTNEFNRIPYDRYAPIRRQILLIHRAVNEARAFKGLAIVPSEDLQLGRKKGVRCYLRRTNEC